MADSDRLLDIGRIQPALGESYARVFRPDEALNLHQASLGGATDKFTRSEAPCS